MIELPLLWQEESNNEQTTSATTTGTAIESAASRHGSQQIHQKELTTAIIKQKIQRQKDTTSKFELPSKNQISSNNNNTSPANGWQQKSLDEFSSRIHRIYYVSKQTKIKRGESAMEEWLSQQSIPYQGIPIRGTRVSGFTDDNLKCVGELNKNRRRCRKAASQTLTTMDILNHYNNSGWTLVLDDTTKVSNISHLVQSVLDLVPQDFDIVRWNCVLGDDSSSGVSSIENDNEQQPKQSKMKRINDKVIQTVCEKPMNNHQHNATSSNKCHFCGGSNVMLWRDSSVSKLRQVWSPEHQFNFIDCQLTNNGWIKSYCIGNDGKHDDYYIETTDNNNQDHLLKEEQLKLKEVPPNEFEAMANEVIDRIYYFNQNVFTKRRNAMEQWLHDQSILYQRIEPTVALNATVQCEGGYKSKPNSCRQVVGLTLSNLDIVDHYNTTGLTLVLNSDEITVDVQLLVRSLKQVPPDFDVVRWNCAGKPLPDFDLLGKNVFRTACTNNNPSGRCSSWYCGGGTDVMLWRQSSIPKLRGIWSKEPFNGLDCRLNTGKIKSYCINNVKGIQKLDWRMNDNGRKNQSGQMISEPPYKHTSSKTIDRIYYINKAANTRRREMMEVWLKNQTIPYQRVEAAKESIHSICVPPLNKHRPNCRKAAGYAQSSLDLLEKYNATFSNDGLNLLLNDEVFVDTALLTRSLDLVPPDFDVVRWNCYGEQPAEFQHFNDHVFRTACTENNITECTIRFCGGHDAILFRRGSSSSSSSSNGSVVDKLYEFWSEQPFDSIDCWLTSTKLKSYCINDYPGNGISRLQPLPSEQDEAIFNPRFNHSLTSIERIYYINMNKNTKRRDFMESWLSRQTIPFQRVEAVEGAKFNFTCVEWVKSAAHCRGAAGLAMSNIKIIDNYNTSGLTLVLEDDYQVDDMTLLMKSLEYVPPDFDVVRWNCWGDQPEFLERHSDYVFWSACLGKVNKTRCEGRPEFYGGTSIVLWRDSGVAKIRELWAKEPYDDIDGRLLTDKIKAYCVNHISGSGYSKLHHEEKSIPKG